MEYFNHEQKQTLKSVFQNLIVNDFNRDKLEILFQRHILYSQYKLINGIGETKKAHAIFESLKGIFANNPNWLTDEQKDTAKLILMTLIDNDFSENGLYKYINYMLSEDRAGQICGERAHNKAAHIFKQLSKIFKSENKQNATRTIRLKHEEIEIIKTALQYMYDRQMDIIDRNATVLSKDALYQIRYNAIKYLNTQGVFEDGKREI